MEMVAYLLKGRQVKLRSMQVVAIEVDDVTVYGDTPREDHSPVAGRLTHGQRRMCPLQMSRNIYISSAMVTTVDKAEPLQQQIHDKDIEEIY